MNKNLLKKTIIISVAILAVVVGIVVYNNTQNRSESESKNDEILRKNEISVVTKKEETITDLKSDPIMENSDSENPITEKPTPLIGEMEPKTKTVTAESGYIKYDETKLTNAEYGRVVLFFHAAWCPSCRGLEKDILDNKDKIPKDLLIMKVEYDTNQDLRKKYQIVQQHTLVLVDQSGNTKKTSQGLYQLNTLESVIKNF
jgi:thioredoxin 1